MSAVLGVAEHPSFLESYFANTRARYVHDDWSVAKPREECQPFTFTMVEIPENYVWRKRAEEAQAELLPKLEAAVNGKLPRSSRRTFGYRISVETMRHRYAIGWMS